MAEPNDADREHLVDQARELLEHGAADALWAMAAAFDEHAASIDSTGFRVESRLADQHAIWLRERAQHCGMVMAARGHVRLDAVDSTVERFLLQTRGLDLTLAEATKWLSAELQRLVESGVTVEHLLGCARAMAAAWVRHR